MDSRCVRGRIHKVVIILLSTHCRIKLHNGRMIIAITNQKGGVGKSTIAANLALATATMKRPTALIDADRQESASTFYKEAEYLTVYQAGEDVRSLADGLKDDFIFIDSPPSVADIPRLAMAAADIVVIPVQPSPLDIHASGRTVEIYNSLAESLGWAPFCYFLLNRIKPGTTLGKEAADYLRSTYELPVLETRLHDYELYKQAPLAGKSVLQLNRRHKAAREMADLVIEMNKIYRKARRLSHS